MNTDEIPCDLITIKKAARLIGNAHSATIRRWIFSGKLKAYRLAGCRFLVSQADVLNLIQPFAKHKPAGPPTKREMTQQQKRTQMILERDGLL